ncbi:MAG: hypothetical protein R6W99_00925 [Clostridia bacterium]
MDKNKVKSPGRGSSEGFFGRFKYLVLLSLNPVGLLKSSEKHKWYIYLVFPATGWLLFFLQIGIERFRQGMFTAWTVILISFLGLVAGYLVVGFIGWMLAYILAYLGYEMAPDKVIALIAMSHTYMVFSVLLGLIYNLFGNSSSASFGIAGLLCTLMPIYAGIRTLGKGKAFLPPLIATLVGVILLFSWQLILIIVS